MIGKIIRVFLVVIASIICGVAVVLHTSFFREEAVDLLESMLEKSIQGDVSLGRLEGILLHRATLRGVSLRDREGRTVLEADLVRIDPDILSLIFDRVLRLENVRLVGPRIYLRTDAEGRLNLSELFATKTSTAPEKTSTGFTPISIDVSNLRILDGFVSYEPYGGARQRVDDIDLWADAELRSERIDAAVRELLLTPSAYPSRLEVRGRATVLPKQISAHELRFSDRFGTSGSIRRLVHELETGSLFARFHLTASSASLRAVTKLEDLRGTAELSGDLTHPSIDGPWLIDATGRINSAPVSIEVRASPAFEKLSADLDVRGPLDPSELYRGAPVGPLQGRIYASLEDAALERLTGDLGINLSGRLRQSKESPAIDLSRFDVDASAEAGKLRASGLIDSDRANARFSMQGSLRNKELELSSAKVKLDITDLSAVVPPSAKMSGAVALNAEVSGRLDSLSGTAEVKAKRLRSGEVKLGDAEVKLAGAAKAPWRVELSSRGADYVERLSLIAQAELGPKGARARFEKLEAKVVDRNWRAIGEPFVEAVSRKRGWVVEVRDLNLTSSAGRIALSGRADLGEKKVHAANLVLAGLDLPAVQDALKIEPKVEGSLDGALEVRNDRDVEGRLSLKQRGREVVTAEVDLQTRGLARIARADGTIRAKLDAFPLSSVKTKKAMTGTVAAALSLAKRGRKIEAEVRANSAQLHWDRRWPKMDVSLDARMRDGDIDVTGWLHGGPAGQIDLRAIALAPADPLAPAGWKKLGLRSVKSVRVQVENSDLTAWTELFDLGAMSGAISGNVVVAEGARRVEGWVGIERFMVPKLERPLDASATIDSAGGSTRLHADVFEARKPLVSFEVSMARDVVQLARTSTRALMRMPVKGELHADRLPVALLSQLLDAGDDASGTLSIDGRLTGSISDPLFNVKLSSNDAAIRTAKFRKIEGYAELSRVKLASRMLMEQRDGGRLDLDARIGLRKDVVIAGRIGARNFDLGFLSLLAPTTKGTLGGVAGKLEADLALSGTRTDPHVEGELKIEGLRAVMQHPVPPVEEGSLDLRFKEDKVIFGMEGRSGNGKFEITGNGVLPSLTKPRLSGQIELEDLSIAAGPRLVKTDLEANWHLSSRDRLIEANVIIVDGSAQMESGAEDRAPIKRFDDVVLVDELGQEFGPTPVEEAEKRIELVDTKTKLRLTVKTEEPIPLRSDDVNASLAVDLVVETTDEGLVARGSIDLSDGTIALFGGRRWYIERAQILFPGGSKEEPTLGVRIYHDFSDVVVYVDVLGKPSAPEIRLSSDPGTYSRDQLLGFVLGGSPDAASTDASLGERASGLAAGFLVGQIQNVLKDKLPIDTLSVDLEEGSRASAVLVGKWLTDRLFLAYNYRIEAQEDENASEGIVRVLFGHGWILEAAYGDRGNGTADVFWVRRF